MKNVLIIGNGFDLDLGLPTRYSDFANSEYWPHVDRLPDGRSVFSIANGEEYHALPFYLDKRSKTDNWFDLEEFILDYATKEVSGLANDLYSAKNDIDYYHELQSKLCDYLIDVQNIKEQSIFLEDKNYYYVPVKASDMTLGTVLNKPIIIQNTHLQC